MTTTILSNGSKFAGAQPDPVTTLIEVLGRHPLDRRFEGYSQGFISHDEITGVTRFRGNFLTASHVFDIRSDDKDVVGLLTDAIETNMAREDYLKQLAPKARAESAKEAGLRLLVTGSRYYNDKETAFAALDRLHETRGPIACLIHGAARGADTLADKWADEKGIQREPHPAAWDDLDAPGAVIRRGPGGRPYNFLAGFQRNEKMAKEADADLVFAFAGGGGTADMIKRAKDAGIEIVTLEDIMPEAPGIQEASDAPSPGPAA